MQFFYQMRNKLGLILVMTSVLAIGFSYPAADSDFPLAIPFLCGLATGIPPLSATLRHLSLKKWSFLCLFFIGAGILFSFSLTLQAFLFGIGSCGFLLILPSNIAIGWFRKSKTMVLATSWLISLWISFLCGFGAKRFLAENLIPPFMVLLFICLLLGIWFLEKPPMVYCRKVNPLTTGRSSFHCKACCYIIFLSTSIGLAKAMASASPLDKMPVSPLSPLYLALGAFLLGFIIEKKGIFSGCIVPILFCEIGICFLGTESEWYFVLGFCLIHMALGSLLVLLPILSYYLYGQIDYAENLAKLSFFLPLGLLAAQPFGYLGKLDALSYTSTMLLTALLLTFSFFSIRFAWRERLVVLKNEAA